MTNPDSRVTIHMAASLDGFIARNDGRVDWIETADEFADGVTMDPEYVTTFLKSIDCYVMGSRTYETALKFEASGAVSGECLRLGLADEVRYSILPIVIGEGVSFFEGLHRDIALHLTEVKAYKSGIVALRYEVC